MSKPLDYLCVVLDGFVADTGRLAASHLDYAQAQEWLELGIPLTVVQRGISEKLARTGVAHYRTLMPLSWCHHDVTEQFDNWKRAIGPRWREAVST